MAMRMPIHWHEREIVLAVLLTLGLALGVGLMLDAPHWWPGRQSPAEAGRPV